MNTTDVLLWSLWNRNTTTGRRILLIDRYVIVGRKESLADHYHYSLLACADVEQARDTAVWETGDAERHGYELGTGPKRCEVAVARDDVEGWLSQKTMMEVNEFFEFWLKNGAVPLAAS